MTFLLNFVHFEAIFADSETIFAYSETDFANFETKIQVPVPETIVGDILIDVFKELHSFF